MNYASIDLQPAELLTAMINQINKRFFESPKDEAKQLYRELADGAELPFMEITASDQGEVLVKLALDHSKFVGKLNFSRFRDALLSHLQRIAGKINNEEGLNVFTSQETGDIIFNIPGAVEVDGTRNILVTGVEQRVAGTMILRLMFLDPNSFE